jgi:general stress protein CsbA
LTSWLDALLLIVFGIHLVAFSVLWFRRRQAYYVALVVTFLLLTASAGTRLWHVDWTIGELELTNWLRFAAWAAAAVSISWTLTRILRRIQAGRQNCS